MTEEKELTGRERSIANLKPFPKGVSGNPSGRPKNVLSKAIRRKLEEVEEGQDSTVAERITEKLVELALGGNIEAIKLLGDRSEGKPRQSVNITTDSRERIDRAVDNLISTAAVNGDTLTREAALALLAEFDDEAAALLNE
jgi:hypothetical protein